MLYQIRTKRLTKLAELSMNESSREWSVRHSALLEELFDTSNQEKGVNQTEDYEIFSREFVETKWVAILFFMMYTLIFGVGIGGNYLVCFVVVRNKAMHTVTNIFISNLAASDILLCLTAVPFTPLYTFTGHWAYGESLCQLVPYAQGVSVYVSTYTLAFIAVDRFFVIIHPFKDRMTLIVCSSIIFGIWIFALFVTFPYYRFMHQKEINGKLYCEEQWPQSWGVTYGILTVVFQFIIPFFAITYCYTKVSIKLTDRARSKPGSKNSRKEELDRERKRRTNRMLIAMVAIFGLCWLPLNAINLLNDLYPHTARSKYYYLAFFVSHTLAMSSTCYNPFLYAWLNENFRKEFKQVLPCCDTHRRCHSAQFAGRVGWRSERTCNGNETCQETLLPTSSLVMNTSRQTEMSSLDLDGLKVRSWTGKNHDSVEIMLVSLPASDERKNSALTANNVVHSPNNAVSAAITEENNAQQL